MKVIKQALLGIVLTTGKFLYLNYKSQGFLQKENTNSEEGDFVSTYRLHGKEMMEPTTGHSQYSRWRSLNPANISSTVQHTLSLRSQREGIRNQEILKNQRLISLIYHSKFSNFLTVILCLTGLFWQMYILINEYFKYNIVSDVSMIKDREVRPPAISICIPFVEDIDWDKLGWNYTYDEWVRLDQSKRDQLTMNLQQNWTIRKVFQETDDLESMKTRGWVRRIDSYEVERDPEFMYIKKYVREDFVCFRITHADVKDDNRSLYFMSHRNSYGNEPGGILSFSLDKKKLRRVTKISIFLHSNNVFPRGDADYPFIFISSNESSIFSDGSTYRALTYTQQTQYFLHPPFKFGCFDYEHHPELGLESQEHCINYCMRMRVLQRFNESSFTATFLEPKDYRIMSKYSLVLNRQKEIVVDKIFKKCLSDCPNIECIQVRYLPALVSTRESADVTFLLQEPNGPECIITFLPKLTLMELYVQIMSICGVWLGVSLSDVVVHGIKLLIRSPKNPSAQRPRIARSYF
jgi:hypothetical protein